jgi:hypothetical protein
LCFDNLYFTANVEVLPTHPGSSSRLTTTRRGSNSSATIALLGVWLASTCTGTLGLKKLRGATCAGHSGSVLTPQSPPFVPPSSRSPVPVLTVHPT